jgi:NADH dehydrogenase/NADH:ubiquinone oxidoreductase subunit G
MPDVTLTIDGVSVTVPAGTTVFEAARVAGILIPGLCYRPNETPVGVCRVCMVDIARSPTQVAACVRPAEPGMVVRTDCTEFGNARRTVVELLLADHPIPCARQRATYDCELEALAARWGIGKPRFAARPERGALDNSSSAISFDRNACILCDACIRACDEIRRFEVVGRCGKGISTRIAFDLGVPLGESTCVSCGECARACPSGSLMALTPSYDAARVQD